MKKVDQAKAIDAMEERKRKRTQGAAAQGGAGGDSAASESVPSGKRAKPAPAEEGMGGAPREGSEGMPEVRRRFKQRKVARDGGDRAVDEVLGLLGGRGSS